MKYATVITVTGRNTAVYDIPSTGRDPAANQPSQQYVNEKFELKQLMVCLFELFDKLVLPILCGWKISGTLAVRDEIEKVHRKFVNMFYVSYQTHLECFENVGDSLSIHYMLRSVKCWIHLVTGHNIYTFML